MENFYTILTDTGKAKIANAHANRVTLELKEMAVGDGAGAYYNPSEKMTALKNEVYRRELNNMTTDPDNLNYLICEMVIPSNAGGFHIREAAIFDTDGDMIAIGKIPETYKPTLDAGAAKDLYMKFVIEVTNSASVTLKIDPTVVLATKDMAEKAAADAVTAHVGQGNPHDQYVAKTAHTRDIENLQNGFNTHRADKTNPHAVTKAQVGLGAVDNTSDLAKPISTATQNALNGKQPVGDYATNTALNSGLAGKAAANHNHNGVYQPVGNYATGSHGHNLPDLTGILSLAKGGTGATTATAARQNLGAMPVFSSAAGVGAVISSHVNYPDIYKTPAGGTWAAWKVSIDINSGKFLPVGNGSFIIVSGGTIIGQPNSYESNMVWAVRIN